MEGHVAGWAGQGHQARCWRQCPQFDLHFKTSWMSGKVSNKYDGLIMWIWGASCYLLCGIDGGDTREKADASIWLEMLEMQSRVTRETWEEHQEPWLQAGRAFPGASSKCTAPHKISIPGCSPSSCTAHLWGPPAAHPFWGWLMALGGSWCPRWRRPV